MYPLESFGQSGSACLIKLGRSLDEKVTDTAARVSSKTKTKNAMERLSGGGVFLKARHSQAEETPPGTRLSHFRRRQTTPHTNIMGIFFITILI